MRIDGNKLDFFKSLYEAAKTKMDADCDAFVKHLAQYKGSDEIDSEYGPPQRAKYVRNITYELIESQVSSYIPTPSVAPQTWSEANERNAKSVETMLKNKRDLLPFEQNNDIDERYSPIYGGSVWLVEWDDGIVTHNTVGDVKCTCIPPNRFVGQPNIYNVQDMEYCFVSFDTTKDEIMRRYNVSEDQLVGTYTEDGEDDDTATLYVCYYKDEDGNVCEYVWSGDAEVLDISDYFARKKYICKTCGKRKGICVCEDEGKKPEYDLLNDEYEEIDRDIITSHGRIPKESQVIKEGIPQKKTISVDPVDENGNVMLADVAGALLQLPAFFEEPVLEKTKLPFYKPSLLPIVIRKNTSVENKLFGQSDCEVIRPQQQAINKIESRVMEKLLGGGVFPILPDDVNIEMNNSIWTTALRCSPENYRRFGKIDLVADISRDLAMADRIYDQAKRILGISDSFQGQYDASAKSGIAKQLQIQQSAGRLTSKRQLKNAAYAEMDRIIFEFMLAYADEPRNASYVDEAGRLQNSTFNRYDFIERDPYDGTYYYNAEYLFSADASADVEKNREYLWNENLKHLQMGAYGPLENPQTLLIYWLNMERAHYPGARDNVMRIREEIQRMAQMEAIEQQLAAEQEKNTGLKKDIENRMGYEQYLMELTGGEQK